jgi:Flp pilus assembly protein TadG
MILSSFRRDVRGVTAVEFAMTAPVFFVMIFGIIEAGLLLWTQLGLQHGVELAARCASINTTVCNNASSVQSYAAQQAFGLNPSPETFTFSAVGCGNQVTATYTFQFVTFLFPMPSISLNAQACFPR